MDYHSFLILKKVGVNMNRIMKSNKNKTVDRLLRAVNLNQINPNITHCTFGIKESRAALALERIRNNK